MFPQLHAVLSSCIIISYVSIVGVDRVPDPRYMGNLDCQATRPLLQECAKLVNKTNRGGVLNRDIRIEGL